MKLNKKLITCAIAFAMIFITSVPALAASGVINIYANQVWNRRPELVRSGASRYVTARCNSVYPLAGTDNFQKIQVRVINGLGSVIIDKPYIVLNETALNNTSMNIQSGYLNTKSVHFEFRGNTNSAAQARVTYFSQ